MTRDDQDRAESERLVGNMYTAYAKLAGNQPGNGLAVASVWPDMVACHGGLIECHV